MVDPGTDSPRLLSVRRIWDQAPHNAFTDLLYHRNEWFCAFRESDNHINTHAGSMRLIASRDGTTWESRALVESAGHDLRDPKLSVTPNGQLMLLVGKTRNKE